MGGSNPLDVHNCVIYGNFAAQQGGGIPAWGRLTSLVNNTIYRNSATTGGGIYGVGMDESGVWILNCVISFNYCGRGVRPLDDTKPYLDYCDLYANLSSKAGAFENGNEYGLHNISVDPLFADVGSADFHLKSEIGRWDAGQDAWVKDDLNSPCIDAGHPVKF